MEKDYTIYNRMPVPLIEPSLTEMKAVLASANNMTGGVVVKGKTTDTITVRSFINGVKYEATFSVPHSDNDDYFITRPFLK